MKIFEVYRELLEDLVDRFICFIRRNEPTIPFDDVIAELERDGILKGSPVNGRLLRRSERSSQ